MKVAVIKTSQTSAKLDMNGKYTFGNAKPGRGQCGEYVNDTLDFKPGNINRAGDTIASKTDAPDFVRKDQLGIPTTGGYFVMDVFRPFGHIGLVRYSDYNEGGELRGFYFTDYNWRSDEKRRDGYIAVGSADWKLIVGFGIGNPTISWKGYKEVMRSEKQISTIWRRLEKTKAFIPEEAEKLSEAQNSLHEANTFLRNIP